jgi:hypothetical protein
MKWLGKDKHSSLLGPFLTYEQTAPDCQIARLPDLIILKTINAIIRKHVKKHFRYFLLNEGRLQGERE